MCQAGRGECLIDLQLFVAPTGWSAVTLRPGGVFIRDVAAVVDKAGVRHVNATSSAAENDEW